MLRNVKVGTKLLAILAAPLLVIVVLVTIGVRERQTVKDSASRVQSMALLASTTADYANQVQTEAIWATTVAGSGGAAGTTELAQQRETTDAAEARFRDALQQVDPTRDLDSMQETIQALDSRLSTLDATRTSFAPGQALAFDVAEDYSAAVDGLYDLNASLGQTVNQAELLRGMSTLTALERIKQAEGTLASQLIAPAYQGAFVDQLGERCSLGPACPSLSAAQQARADITQASRSYEEITSPQDRQREQNSEMIARFEEQADLLLSQGITTNVVSVAPTALTTAAVQRVSGLEEVDTILSQRVIDRARTLEDDASRAVLLYLLAGAAGIAVALAIAVMVSRSITRPLSRLTTAANRLSNEQLPALVEQLRNPEDETADTVGETFTEIRIESRDEIGELATAFNSIQAVTVDVAQEQGKLLRKGIGDIFVNLARRNQSLLDRQIEFIDQLETSERDPDQLENLFRLDHLATRMRRNAESLLVMAGADPPRRRGAPLPVADVVRVAIGEVEDYRRVHLLALDDATVAANVAADLAHLLSELMENATTASPPHTSVEVIGGYDERNGYLLSVSDRGIGMSEEQLADANALLARPPVVGLAISRSLGLTVASRLAARHGFIVRLDSRDEGGVVATVGLPYGLVEYPGDDSESTPSTSPMEVMAAVDGRPTRTRRTPNRPRPVSVPAGAPTASPNGNGNGAQPVAPQPVVVAPVAPAPVESTPSGLPKRRAAEPATTAAPAGTAAPTVTAAPSVAPASPRPTDTAPPLTTAAPAVTAAGLTRRTPIAARAQAEAPAPTRSANRAGRSPEEVRRMLSRYRSGLDRGRTTPDAPGSEPTNGSVVPESPTRGGQE